jgi:APA family basic amino acid/polyamine antiporter
VRAVSPGPSTLVATGCGTAIACVCAVGLLELERHLGGVWSVAAVLVAAGLCLALARVLGRLSAVVPSGVGLLAFLSRGLGRRRALLLMFPYLLLVLALVAVEARIVGAVLARLLPVPPLGGSLAFLVGTWAVARTGARPGLRAQAAATWALMGGFALLAVTALVRAGRDPAFWGRLLPVAPSPGAFAGGVGQALFLFMGFELVTTQTELVRTPQAIAAALRRSVLVLAAFYGVAALGMTAVAPGEAATPQLLLVPAAAGTIGAAGIGLLCLLASFTSWNGALLTLSRLVYALAAQGFLPRGLARMDSRRLVPPNALLALLAAAVLLTLLLDGHTAVALVLGGAAASAALVWAAAVAVRERAPFAEPGRAGHHRWTALALAALFVAFGAGAVLASFPHPTTKGEIAHVR